jgi:hypothetical protein
MSDLLAIQVRDVVSNSAVANFTIPIVNPVSIPTTLPAATVGVAYSAPLTFSGGTSPYTASLISQTGSNTWSISGSNIVGTPTAGPETDELTVLVFDANGIPQSAILPLIVNGTPPPPSSQIKFTGGLNGIISTRYNSSTSQWQQEINAYAANPTGVGFYLTGVRWADMDVGNSLDNTLSHAQNGTGNYSGFQTLANVYNYLMSKVPTALFGFYITGNVIWGAPGPTYSLSNGPVPNYILNCGGSLTVPNSFGSGSTTTYTLARQSNGQYGWAVYNYGSPNYPLISPCWWDPGVNQCWINFHQALAAFRFTPTAGPFAGQSVGFDTICQYIAQNDELSYSYDTSGTFAPAYTSSSNEPTPANFLASLTAYYEAATAAFPTTRFGTCLSYSFSTAHGTFGSDSDWATQIQLWFGNGTWGTGIRGLTFSDADTVGNNNTFAHGSPARAAFCGQISGSTDLRGFAPNWNQVQDGDYSQSLNSGVAAGTTNPSPPAQCVLDIIAAAALVDSPNVGWSYQDANFNTTAWTHYIYPTFTGAATQPVTLLPVNLMYAPAAVSAAATSSTTATISWTAITGQGTGLDIVLYRNSTQIASGAAATFTSYNDTGLTASTTYIYSIAMKNSNGYGPTSPGVEITTP